MYALIGNIDKEQYEEYKDKINEILFEIEENGNETHNKRLCALLSYLNKLETKYQKIKSPEKDATFLKEINNSNNSIINY